MLSDWLKKADKTNDLNEEKQKMQKIIEEASQQLRLLEEKEKLEQITVNLKYEEDLLLSVLEVSKILRVSRNAVYDMIHQDSGFPVIKLGRKFRVRRLSLQRWLEQQENK